MEDKERSEPTPEVLRALAIEQLQNKYDPEQDSFFVVITKKGKVPGTDLVVDDQAFIGEVELYPILLFVWKVVLHFSSLFGEHPFIFVSRHILSPFVRKDDEEIREAVEKHRQQQDSDSEYCEKIHEESDSVQDAFPDLIVSKSDLSIKN